MKKQCYIILIYIKNELGVINKILGIFNRRRILIYNISVAHYSSKAIFRLAIEVNTNKDKVDTITKYINNVIEVIKAINCPKEDLICKSSILYRLPINKIDNYNSMINNLYKDSKILYIDNQYLIIEKLVDNNDIDNILNQKNKLNDIEYLKIESIGLVKDFCN